MGRGLSKTAVCAIAAAGLIAIPSAVAASGKKAAANCGGYVNQEPTASNITQIAAATFCLVNYERTSRGLRALSFNAKLDKAGKKHSADMIARHYFEHTSPDGVTALKRIKASGYLKCVDIWSWAENIYWGWGNQGTPNVVVQGWMGSTAHRRNILNGGLKEAGMGVVFGIPNPDDGGTKYGATFTQDFGSRKGRVHNCRAG